MNVNERVELVRNTLKLSQEEFGKDLVFTDLMIADIEEGVHAVTEDIKRAICFKYNISYIWLDCGLGEMIETDPFNETFGKFGTIMQQTTPDKELLMSILVDIIYDASDETCRNVVDKIVKNHKTKK